MNAIAVAEGWYFESRDKSTSDREAIIKAAAYVLEGRSGTEMVKRLLDQPQEIRESVRAAAIEIKVNSSVTT